MTEEVDFFRRENNSKDAEILTLSKEISEIKKLNKSQKESILSKEIYRVEESERVKERGERISELNTSINKYKENLKWVNDYFKFKKINLFSVFIKLGSHVYDDERLPIKTKEADNLINRGLVRKISDLRFDFTDKGAYFYELHIADKLNIEIN